MGVGWHIILPFGKLGYVYFTNAFNLPMIFLLPRGTEFFSAALYVQDYEITIIAPEKERTEDASYF